MQSTIPDTSHFWTWIVGALFTGATIVAGIVKLFLYRKTPKADIHESQARAALARATAWNKDADTMRDVFETLKMAHKNFDECERHARDLQRRNDDLEAELQRFRDAIKLD